MNLPAVSQNSIRSYIRGALFRSPRQVMSYLIALDVVKIKLCRISPGHVLLQTTQVSFFLYMTNKLGSLLPHGSVLLSSVTTKLDLFTLTKIEAILFHHIYSSLRSILGGKQGKVAQQKMDRTKRVKDAKSGQITSKPSNIRQIDGTSCQKSRNSKKDSSKQINRLLLSSGSIPDQNAEGCYSSLMRAKTSRNSIKLIYLLHQSSLLIYPIQLRSTQQFAPPMWTS